MIKGEWWGEICSLDYYFVDRRDELDFGEVATPLQVAYCCHGHGAWQKHEGPCGGQTHWTGEWPRHFKTKSAMTAKNLRWLWWFGWFMQVVLHVVSMCISSDFIIELDCLSCYKVDCHRATSWPLGCWKAINQNVWPCSWFEPLALLLLPIQSGIGFTCCRAGWLGWHAIASLGRWWNWRVTVWVAFAVWADRWRSSRNRMASAR